MAKEPKPFYRSGKRAWYIQLRDGSQKSLGKLADGEDEPKKDKRGRWNPPEDVMKEYHKLMLHEGHDAVRERYRVREVFDVYLDYAEKETASYDSYSKFLNDAAKAFGHLWLDDLRPLHVTKWLRGKGTWNDTTRNMAVTVVKAAVNYCVKQGYVKENPIRLMPVPKPETRDRVLSKEEREELYANIRDRWFRDYLRALELSGARPGEVANLTTEQVNLDVGVWVLQRHKTRRKTKKPRVIYLSPELLELTRQRLAEVEPGGLLFPNRAGTAWNRFTLGGRFKRLRKKLPHLKDVFPYTFRAGFATDALESGVPGATVAELLGHSGTRMLEKHYSRLSQKVEHLKQAAGQATGGCAAKGAGQKRA